MGAPRCSWRSASARARLVSVGPNACASTSDTDRDDGPECRWQSCFLRDPLPRLLEIGRLNFDAKLQARAADLFNR